MTEQHEDLLQRAAKAARDGQLETLQQILKASPLVITARDSEGHSLLGLACMAATGDIALPRVPGTREQHQAVDQILKAGADPSACANNGWAPLHTAAMSGHTDLARRLVSAGAHREGRLLGCDGGSALALSLFYAQTETARILADPLVPDNLRTAAALGRNLDRFLDGNRLTTQASEGLDFYRPTMDFPDWKRTNSRQEILNEALSWSARNNQCQSMETLVALGADVNANPYRGTPLLWAVYADRVEAADWLLDNHADTDLRHDFGGAQHGKEAVAMHLAAQYANLKCLKLLLDRGADPTIKDHAFNGTPLGWARHAGAESAIALIESYLES